MFFKKQNKTHVGLNEDNNEDLHNEFSESTENDTDNLDSEVIKIELFDSEENLKTEIDEDKKIIIKSDDSDDSIERKKPKISLNTQNKIVCFLLAAILIVFFANIKMIKNNIKNNKTTDKNVIGRPLEYVNNSNFAYVNKSISIGDEEINITKITIDPVATIIYLAKTINISKYEITMKDNLNNNYKLDYGFYDFSKKNMPNLNQLRMQPIKNSASSFTVTIKDIFSEKEDNIEFVKSEDFGISALKEAEYYPLAKNCYISINLIKGLFSSAGTTIFYEIVSDNPNVVFTAYNDENIKMIEGVKELLKTNKIKEIGDKSKLFRADFSPVKDLSSKIKVKFNNIYKTIYINKSVELNTLMYFREPIIVEVENFVINFEGFKKTDYGYILVSHVSDNLSEVIEKDIYSNRVKASYEIYLEGIDEKGDFSIKGDIKTKKEGADISFNTDRIFLDKYNIYIKSITIKEDSLEGDIYLGEIKSVYELEDFNFENRENKLLK